MAFSKITPRANGVPHTFRGRNAIFQISPPSVGAGASPRNVGVLIQASIYGTTATLQLGQPTVGSSVLDTASLNRSCQDTLMGGVNCASSNGDYPYFGYNIQATNVVGNYVFRVTDNSVAIKMGSSQLFQFFTGGSGSAGGAITFTERFRVGPSSLQGFGTTAAALVDMAPDKSSFTFTLTGCTTSPTGTAFWSKQGNQVTLTFPAALVATSNSTACTLTGLPAVIQPTRTQSLPLVGMENATAVIANGNVVVQAASGTVLCQINANSSGWTASGTKGLNAGGTITYLLN